MIGNVINSKLATLNELQTVYGTEDLFDLYEVIMVKLHNENVVMERKKR